MLGNHDMITTFLKGAMHLKEPGMGSPPCAGPGCWIESLKIAFLLGITLEKQRALHALKVTSFCMHDHIP